MFWFFLGFYLCGYFVALVVVTFFTILGGRNEDLWRPFIVPVFWPIVAIPFFIGVWQSFTGRNRR